MMEQNTWDNRFLALAEHIARWSKDPSTQVGAVIVNPINQVIGVGYNGFPRGVNDTQDRLHHRPSKYAMIVHAEQNAILNANSSVDNCTIYIWPQFYDLEPPTCNECAKFIIQSGITRVVGSTTGTRGSLNRQYRMYPDEEWADRVIWAGTMYKEAGVVVDYI